MPPRSPETFLSDQVAGLHGQFGENVARSLVRAVDAAGTVHAQQLRVIAEVFREPARDRGRRALLHQQIGRAAQRSVLASYAQLVTAREGPAARTHYRAGRGRLAGGVLRRALARPDFFEADAEGIRFINETMLYREAAHWHRIAFGAGARGDPTSTRHEIRFSNLVVAAIGIEEDPSPAFRIPRGIWISPEGGRVRAGENPRGADMFYPALRGGRSRLGPAEPARGRVTAGIEGRNFFDAGVRRIARELPRAYENYYREIYAEFRQGRGPLRQVESTVRLVAPRTMSSAAVRIR